MGRHRRRKIKSLGLPAAPVVQQSHLISRFNALGDDPYSQLAGQADRRFDDRRGIGVSADILDEFLRDL